MHGAEIAVRFGDTLLEVTRIAHGATYHSPLTGLPLVESTPRGFVVHGRPLEAAVTFTSGHVTFSISRVTPAPVLERRRMERRPVPFIAASLVAHAVLLVIAIFNADLDPITVPVVTIAPERRPVHIARIEEPKKQPEPKKPIPAQQPKQTSPTPEVTPTNPREAGIAGSASLDDLSMVTGHADLAKELSDVFPIYDEVTANEQNFGNSGGRFKPEDDPDFDSVKVGPYATVSSGRGAGAHFRLPGEVERPPLMALACDDNSCVVEGTMDRFKVRDIIEKRYVDLVKCYAASARANPRVEITLQFEIGTDGKASDVRADGLDPVGSCVARIVQRSKFPPGDQPTRVSRYPMAFWRT